MSGVRIRTEVGEEREYERLAEALADAEGDKTVESVRFSFRGEWVKLRRHLGGNAWYLDSLPDLTGIGHDVGV